MTKDTVWNSILAEEMTDYLRLRESQGHINRKDRTVLKTVDHILVKLNISEKAISQETAEKWFHSLSAEMSVNTRIVYLSHFRQFSRYLNTLGYPTFVPESPLPEKIYIPYIFSEEEMVRLIHAADIRIGSVHKSGHTEAVQFSVILRLLWGCGLRLNEVLMLKVRDADTENGLLLIRNAKGNKDRLVPMHPSLTAVLGEYMREYSIDPEMYLFPGRKTRPHPQGWARTIFCNCLETAGIVKPKMAPYARNICLHCIRHSFAVASFRQLQQNGYDLYEEVPILSTYLGHENIYGTEQYLHMTQMNGTDILHCMESLNNDIFPEVTL